MTIYPSLIYISLPDPRTFDMTVPEDLQLNRLIDASVWEAVNTPCSAADISARQELFCDLSAPDMRRRCEVLLTSAERLCRYSRLFSESVCDARRDALFALSADAFAAFAAEASDIDGGVLASRFGGFFRKLTGDRRFSATAHEAAALTRELSALEPDTVNVHIREGRMTAGSGESFFASVTSCALRLGLGKPTVTAPDPRRLGVGFINAIAGLHPELFTALKRFRADNKGFFDPDILAYRGELRFLISICELFEKVRSYGIPYCFPEISEKRIIRLDRAYDITLFAKDEYDIVPNDAIFDPDSPFYYLTGANGGGKTTYLRAVGISVFLFSLGCPVPCADAEISPIDGIFAHFPRDERFDGTGRFVEENNRVQDILSKATTSSLVLLNETYSTTGEEKSREMTSALADRLYGDGIFGLYITHQHSLEKSPIPYLNVLVDSSDTNRRTFRVAREKDTHGSYALDILQKYGIDRESLQERFGIPD